MQGSSLSEHTGIHRCSQMVEEWVQSGEETEAEGSVKTMPVTKSQATESPNKLEQNSSTIISSEYDLSNATYFDTATVPGTFHFYPHDTKLEDISKQLCSTMYSLPTCVSSPQTQSNGVILLCMGTSLL
ncbi:hypothetical protein STEG23_023707 [Scotinomys teguina]